jgi:hypothetical protein
MPALPSARCQLEPSRCPCYKTEADAPDHVSASAGASGGCRWDPLVLHSCAALAEKARADLTAHEGRPRRSEGKGPAARGPLCPIRGRQHRSGQTGQSSSPGVRRACRSVYQQGPPLGSTPAKASTASATMGCLPPPTVPRALPPPAHSSMWPRSPPTRKSSPMLRRIRHVCWLAHARAAALA